MKRRVVVVVLRANITLSLPPPPLLSFTTPKLFSLVIVSSLSAPLKSAKNGKLGRPVRLEIPRIPTSPSLLETSPIRDGPLVAFHFPHRFQSIQRINQDEGRTRYAFQFQ